ncbi:MAG TPA: pteridine reductase [Motiliproteus sp.]
MSPHSNPKPAAENAPVVLITGAARRIGATLARRFHAEGYRVLIHYRHNHRDAYDLTEQLNLLRPDSAHLLQADLTIEGSAEQLAGKVLAQWQQLDLLINNASSFYPTPFGQVSYPQWHDLIGSNLAGPFFLAQALAPELTRRNGAIINLVDVHSQKPLKDFSTYCIAKAGNAMLVQVLAKELAPAVRVNGISPGPILPPEGAAERDPSAQQQVVNSTLLGRYGDPDDIADTALFLARQSYVTGQIISVDGGKSLYT